MTTGSVARYVPWGHSMGQEHGVVIQLLVAPSCIMGVCHVAGAGAWPVVWSPSACCRCAAWGEAVRQTKGDTDSGTGNVVDLEWYYFF